MKARRFGYHRATTLDQALALLRQHGSEARVIAGGQSLVPAMNLRLATPSHLVDIAPIEALRGIHVVRENGTERLRIGALVRHIELQRSPDVARCAPLLSEAVRHVAHAAIRNRGTFGGSIAHADPASEFPACALALGARMIIAGPGGQRSVAAGDFFKGLHETAVQPGEILVAVEVETLGEGKRSGFAELARRSGDYAMVGLAVVGRPQPERTLFHEVAPVFFAVGDRPILARAVAQVLCDGALPDSDRVRLAQTALERDIAPPSSPGLSGKAVLHLARVLLGRVVATVCAEPSKSIDVG